MLRTNKVIGNLFRVKRMTDIQPKLMICLLLFVSILSVTGNCSQATKAKSSKATKRMCITFDELPAARSFGETDREAITYLLLDGLRRHEVKAVGFVIGDQIEEKFFFAVLLRLAGKRKASDELLKGLLGHLPEVSQFVRP